MATEDECRLARCGSDDPPLTVADAVRSYLADRETEGQDTQRAIQQLEAHVLPMWGSCRIAELTAPALRAWRNKLAATPPRIRRSKQHDGPRFAAADLEDAETRRRRRSTVNRITTTFKAALNFAARMHPDECPRREVWQEGLKAFRHVEKPRERWLEPSEVVRLIAACPPDFGRLVQAALYTGCRYSELCRAKVQDYEPRIRALRIRAAKSGKWRHVVVHEEAAAFFEGICRGRHPGEWLLTRRDPPGPWGRAHQVRPMAEACRRASITPPISFHGLRHTYASLAVQSGMALVALARNLGHADTRMVEKHYGHLSNQYMSEQVGRHAPTFEARTRARQGR